MPANLTPEFRRLDGLLREARTPEEKLPILKQMLIAIPKHKGTEKMQADIKRRISKLQDSLEQKKRSGGGRADPFHVPKEGAGQVVLTGPPNAGKSSLLNALTHASPQIAEYPFTTVQPQVGMIPFGDIQIELVDAPPLTREHFLPGMINLYRNADLLLVVADLCADDPVEEVKDVLAILSEHLVDAVPPGEGDLDPGQVARVKKPAVVIANKIDGADAADWLELLAPALTPLHVIPVCAENADSLKEIPAVLFEGLGIVRIYTKKPGYKFDKSAPYILPRGSTVIDAARVIHKEIAEGMKSAKVWGSAKYEGQAVQRDHVLEDGDIVEFHL